MEKEEPDPQATEKVERVPDNRRQRRKEIALERADRKRHPEDYDD